MTSNEATTATIDEIRENWYNTTAESVVRVGLFADGCIGGCEGFETYFLLSSRQLGASDKVKITISSPVTVLIS